MRFSRKWPKGIQFLASKISKISNFLRSKKIDSKISKLKNMLSGDSHTNGT